MIGSLADLFGHEGSKVERAAVASDTRGGAYFEGLVKVLEDLERGGVPYRLLFLEASDPVLINRFKETRRRHPLADGGSVEAAIRDERERARAAEGARRRLDRHLRPVAPAGCARSWRTRCSRTARSAGWR